MSENEKSVEAGMVCAVCKHDIERHEIEGAHPCYDCPCEGFARPASAGTVLNRYCADASKDLKVPNSDPPCRMRCVVHDAEIAALGEEVERLEGERDRERAEHAETLKQYGESVRVLSSALRGPETSIHYDTEFSMPVWAQRAAAELAALRERVEEAEGAHETEARFRAEMDEENKGLRAEVERLRAAWAKDLVIANAETKRADKAGAEVERLRIRNEGMEAHISLLIPDVEKEKARADRYEKALRYTLRLLLQQAFKEAEDEIAAALAPREGEGG